MGHEEFYIYLFIQASGMECAGASGIETLTLSGNLVPVGDRETEEGIVVTAAVN